MSGIRLSTWIGILLVCVSVGYVGYDMYSKYVVFSETMAKDKARAAQIAATRAQLNSALLEAGVSVQQASSGFWYTLRDADGNESVLYYNPDQWASYDLTDTDVKTLASQLGGASRFDRGSMKDVPTKELPSELQFHNALYGNTTPGAFHETQGALEEIYKNGTATAQQLWELSYMYELQGAYSKRDAVNAESCKRFKQRCVNEIMIRTSGNVVDTAGRAVQGAKVSVLGHEEVSAVTTNQKGEFTIALSVKPMEKIRVSATKRNFSSGVVSAIVLGAGKTAYRMDTIVLASAIAIVTVDTVKHTVSNPVDTARPDGSFILHATSTTYDIPAEAIVDEKGNPYRGLVDVYIYEFTKDTVPQSLVTLDTFDEVMGYAGNLMKSYGMPIIQFFAQDGRPLDVTDKKPMTITYRVAGMDDLKNNTDNNLPEPLTNAHMETLVAASKGDPGFPITADFLVRHKIFTFPPFWVLNRGSGVWDNVGMRVLDVSGVIQAPFYTIKK